MKFLKITVNLTTVLLLLSGLLSATAFADAADEPHGILLSWTCNPSSSMTFTWLDALREGEAVQVVSELEYRDCGFMNAAEFDAAAVDVSLDGTGVWRYEATATGLEPAATYAYRVGSGAVWSATEYFTTQSLNSSSLTFAYMGDAQTAGNTEEDYAVWGELVKAIYERNPELAFAVLGGDNVNSGISINQFELLTENAETVFSKVPLFSTIGNHESNFIGGKAEIFLDWFAFPQNGPEGFAEELYSFDAANCHVMVLNSWVFSGEQPLTDEDYERINDWIAADLAQSTADWQIVVTHVPVYAVASDTTATKVKESWAPIFEKYGVDLVLEGHQHVYSRSYPMYEDKIDYKNGIIYVMGVSGSKFYDNSNETFAERVVYGTSNYQLVQIDGNMLTVQTLDAEGNELDYFSVMQRAVSATREEYIEALWKGLGSPEAEGASPFTDTDAQAVVWAYENEIVVGYGDGTFGAGDMISSQQINTILERMGAAR